MASRVPLSTVAHGMVCASAPKRVAKQESMSETYQRISNEDITPVQKEVLSLLGGGHFLVDYSRANVRWRLHAPGKRANQIGPKVETTRVTVTALSLKRRGLIENAGAKFRGYNAYRIASPGREILGVLA